MIHPLGTSNVCAKVNNNSFSSSWLLFYQNTKMSISCVAIAIYSWVMSMIYPLGMNECLQIHLIGPKILRYFSLAWCGEIGGPSDWQCHPTPHLNYYCLLRHLPWKQIWISTCRLNVIIVKTFASEDAKIMIFPVSNERLLSLQSIYAISCISWQ